MRGPVLRDGDGVLGVRRTGSVHGVQRPPVRRYQVVIATAGHEHRLDGEHQAVPQAHAAPRPAVIGDVRVLVHPPADAVTPESGRDAVAGSPCHRADRGRDVPDPGADHGGRDSGRERLLGGLDQQQIGRIGGADGEADGGVTRPPVEFGTEVDADQVTLAQPVAGRGCRARSRRSPTRR